MSKNPIQSALDFLGSGHANELRAVAIRITGDGNFLIRTYLNSVPQDEVNLGGKKELTEALSSLSLKTPARRTHETFHQVSPSETDTDTLPEEG